MDHRLVLLAGSAVAVAIAACSSLLGIEDAEPLVDGGVEAQVPATTPDADRAIADGGSTPPVPTLRDATCAEAFCADAGGSCGSGACRIECTRDRCAKNGVIDCPVGTDCQVVCPKDACEGLRCRGGRCSFECATGSCKGVACSGEECHFRCNVAQACKDGALFCDGGRCTAECTGQESCAGDQGIRFEAARECSITCSGEKSCGAGSHPPISCGASPAAMIRCGDGACSAGIPQCSPPGAGRCEIACGDGSCGLGHCCGGVGICVALDAGPDVTCR